VKKTITEHYASLLSIPPGTKSVTFSYLKSIDDDVNVKSHKVKVHKQELIMGTGAFQVILYYAISHKAKCFAVIDVEVKAIGELMK
jgi:hypothetical protein